jgi:two-component system phosphate regulon response regulator PhoB
MGAVCERILIIDDHDASATALRLGFERRGHACKCATGGDEALTQLAEFMPTVVLLEWALRDGSGRGLAGRLRVRAHEIGAPVLIVALSFAEIPPHFSDDEDIDDYLIKPSMVETIERCISTRIRRSGLNQE